MQYSNIEERDGKFVFCFTMTIRIKESPFNSWEYLQGESILYKVSLSLSNPTVLPVFSPVKDDKKQASEDRQWVII